MSKDIISRLNNHLIVDHARRDGGFGAGIHYEGDFANNNFGRQTNTGQRPSELTRYLGGSKRTNQPFISGYHHVWFKLPSALYKEAKTEEHSAKWLRSTCESFTPHSSTLNMIDVNGIGQVGASFPASKTVNREFTLAFREYQQLPILNILRTWHAIFDQHLGASPLGPGGFIPVNYKGWVAVAIMKPTFNVANGKLDIRDLEEAYIYDGVVPMTVPEDTVTAADQATNDSVQASVSFRFDGAPLDLSWKIGNQNVGQRIVDLFNEGSYYDNYEMFDAIGRWSHL